MLESYSFDDDQKDHQSEKRSSMEQEDERPKMCEGVMENEV